MTWVIGRGGRVISRSDWTSAANVDAFLQRYGAGRQRRPPSGSVAPYVTEQIEFRDVDREAFYAHLERMGPRSYAEFKEAERIWSERD